MLETKNILKEIKEYNHIKVQNNDNYNFKHSDNAYLIYKGSILSYGDNNFTQLLGELDPVGFAEIILARKKYLDIKFYLI